MRVFVTKSKNEKGEPRYDYVAERPASGTITCHTQDYAGADESVRASLRQQFSEVIIFEEGFPA